jgi:hypothetical protein
VFVRSIRGLFSAGLLVGLLAGCAATRGAGITPTEPIPEAARCEARDPHGDLLALLPPQAAGWGRVDAARARASRHWGPVTALLTQQGLMDTVRSYERVLGADLLGASERLAGAVYARSGADAPRAVLAVHGGVDSTRVRVALAGDDRPVRDGRHGPLSTFDNGEVMVSFVANDVMLVFHPSLADDVVRQWCSVEGRTLYEEPRTRALWERAGARRASLAQTASEGSSPFELALGDETMRVPPFERAVAWIDGEDAVTVRAVGQASSAIEASAFVGDADRVRRAYGGRFLVRLMGFGRLLNEGVSIAADGAFVRIAVDATGTEVTRALQAANAGAALR